MSEKAFGEGNALKGKQWNSHMEEEEEEKLVQEGPAGQMCGVSNKNSR